MANIPGLLEVKDCDRDNGCRVVGIMGEEVKHVKEQGARHEQELSELYSMQRENQKAFADQAKNLALLNQAMNTLHDTVQLLTGEVRGLKEQQAQQIGSSSTGRVVLQYIFMLVCAVLGCLAGAFMRK